MNYDNDFKRLWNKQETSSIPETKEIFAKASYLKKKTRNKMIWQNALLIGTLAFIVFIANYFQPKMVTTKIGIILIIIAILSYVVSSIHVIQNIFKNNIESANTEFLKQFIHLKQRQEWMQKTLLTFYFIFLSIGIFFYMIEYAQMMSMTGRIVVYGITMGWIALNWFYFRPRTLKKQQSELNEIISKLEIVNKQLS